MPADKKELTFRTVSTIKEIPCHEWDRLFGEDTIEGWRYHKTIEESGIREFRILYLVAQSDARYAAIIPFFIMDFSFTTVIQGPLQKIILAIQKIFPRAFKARMLFVGLPTAEELYLGLDKEYDFSLIMDGAMDKLSEFCRREKIISILFYNLTEKHKALAEYLKIKRFARMENFPNTLLTLDTPSWEDYLKKLSKNTRKDIRRKINKTSSLTKLDTQITEDIDGIKDEIYRLYLNNFNESDIQFETLTPEFFQNICRNMPGVAKFFITRDHTQKIVAFNLCIIQKDFCIDKCVGFDKETAHKYNLYNATLIHNLEWCIKNRIKYYQLGITAYSAKLRMGASLMPMDIFVFINNPFLNRVFTKPIAKFVQPKNFDPTLRKLKIRKQ